ncbi:MAG TPA: hypothetical protein VGC49_03370 [Solirubrobacterales bacterium]|jgi:hypothetical protein
MREIRITPAMQLTALGLLIAAIAAAVLVQMPELKRYLKMRQM